MKLVNFSTGLVIHLEAKNNTNTESNSVEKKLNDDCAHDIVSNVLKWRDVVNNFYSPTILIF